MKAVILGGSGYLGAELLRLLAAHPQIEVASVQADSSAGLRLDALYPGLNAAYGDAVFNPTQDADVEGYDVCFVALPSGRSQDHIPELLQRVGVVVDLGADFRLRDAAAYPVWYGFTHRAPELLATAAYGMPELFRSSLVGAQLIAAPGCYVTAASIALAPLLRAGAIERTGIIIDAVSGTSGGGREPAPAFHHAHVNENFTAYGLLNHRHTPEIEQAIEAEVLFTPHLAPMTRGILATCYARPSAPSSTEDFLQLLALAYADEPFVQVTEQLPATRDTYGANTIRITARVDPRTGHAIILSCLDNLTKGGAGQAIQAANIALGLPEAMGLPTVGLLP